MKRRTAEWIAAFDRRVTRHMPGDAKPPVSVPRPLGSACVSCRERQTTAVEHASPWNLANEVKHAWVVLVSTDAIGLNAEVRSRRVGVGVHELHAQENNCDRN